jgi:hypothetical protein
MTYNAAKGSTTMKKEYACGKSRAQQLTLKSTSYLLYATVKNIDKREYDELDPLSSSVNTEISRLSTIAKTLIDRLESLER